MTQLYDDTDDYFEPARPARRNTTCQCDGEAVGPCPGPYNCPYSGCEPEEDDDEDLHPE